MAAEPPQQTDAPTAADEADASSPSDEGTEKPLYQRLTAFETVLITGGLVLFLVLLYEMEVPSSESSFLNPVLIAAAGTILLWPLRQHRAVRALMLSGGFLLILWFVDKVSGILATFLAVYLLAYLLNPAVRYLQDRFGIRRWISSLFVTLVVVGSLVAFVLILAPNIASQIENLSGRIVDGLDHLRQWLATTPVLDDLEAAGFINKEAAIPQFTKLVQSQVGALPEAARKVLQSLGSVFGIFTILALVPVILFYTLKDYPRIQDALIDLFPTFGGQRDYLIEAGTIVGNYLRGQLIISAIAAFNISFFLLLGGVPFWLLIGILGGLLNFIPNLGAIITMILGVLVALIFGGWIKVLIVVVVLLGEALLEQTILTPNILSYQVGLHPILVLLSLLVFGSFLGIFGLLIAVPVTAILVTAYKAYREELTLDLNEYGAPPEPETS